ncbi:MAG: M20 family metallopeptidase [Halodesulfurarchaeum sp.]
MSDAPRSEDLETLIADLVGFETENPPGNERPCAEFVVDWFDEHGIDADLLEKPDAERPQVGATIGEGSPTLVLNGHMDVVPAGDRAEWSHDPFGGDVEGGSLYGRGSVDMKTGLALAMVTAAELRPEIDSGELSGSLVVHAAMGEETAEPGTKTLLEEGYDGDYGVVLEPTGLRTATSEKGLAFYEFEVDGTPSHASSPDQGKNAILDARRVLEALEEYDARVRERRHELLGRELSTITKIEGGTKENVVPEDATITIDRRFLPERGVEEIDRELEDVLADLRDDGIDVELRRPRTFESAEIPVDTPIAETFRTHSADIADVPADPWGIPASTDVRNFINDADIPAITWGPGDIDQAHTYDEHVDLTEAGTGLDILLAASRDLLS